jgi:hypothetical protein
MCKASPRKNYLAKTFVGGGRTQHVESQRASRDGFVSSRVRLRVRGLLGEGMRNSCALWNVSVCLIGIVCGTITAAAQNAAAFETNRLRPPTRLFTNANGEIGVVYGTSPVIAGRTGQLVGPVESNPIRPPTRLFTNANGEIGVILGTTSPSSGRVFTNANGEVGAVWQRPEDIPARHGPGQFFTNANGEVGAIWDTPTRRGPTWATNQLTGAIFQIPPQIPWTPVVGQTNSPSLLPGNLIPPGNNSVPPGSPVLPGNNVVPPGNPILPGNNVVPPGNPIPPGNSAVPPGSPILPGNNVMPPGNPIKPGNVLPPGNPVPQPAVPPPQPNLPPPNPGLPPPRPAPPAPIPAK